MAARFGFFSKKHADRDGFQVYLDAKGEEVRVTTITKDHEAKDYQFKDKEFRGEVFALLYSIEPNTNKPQ